MQRYLAGAGETESLGAALAEFSRPGVGIYLDGELGSGKTTLVRGFLRRLDCSGPVRSPSYTLVEEYETASFPVFHFDLYRLHTPAELETIGVRDYFDGRGVCIVEWPERGAGYLPPADIVVHLAHADRGRSAVLQAGSPAGSEMLQAL